MNVHLERSWARGGYDVTFYRRGLRGGTVELLHFDESVHGGLWWETLPESSDTVAPSLFLPSEALEALLRDAGKVLAATDATVDALNDARAVRDRLLVLVEKGWGDG